MNLGKILAWFIVVVCSVVNVVLLGSAIELPTLSGAGAAQADLGLYVVVMAVGVPVTIVSGVFIAATFLVKERAKGLAGVLRYNNGACIVAFVNTLIPVGILYWLLEIWKH